MPQGLPGFSKAWKWHSERRKLKLPSSGWLEALGTHTQPSKAQWAAAFPAHAVDYAALNNPPGDCRAFQAGVAAFAHTHAQHLADCLTYLFCLLTFIVHRHGATYDRRYGLVSGALVM